MFDRFSGIKDMVCILILSVLCGCTVFSLLVKGHTCLFPGFNVPFSMIAVSNQEYVSHTLVNQPIEDLS